MGEILSFLLRVLVLIPDKPGNQDLTTEVAGALIGGLRNIKVSPVGDIWI